MIRSIIVSITIHNQIYIVRVNEIKVEHIDEINQTSFIAYLQKINARLYSSLIIKKMIWSQKIIQEKKIFDFLYRDRHCENDKSIIIRRIVESLRD
jgi:hypothetical protein